MNKTDYMREYMRTYSKENRENVYSAKKMEISNYTFPEEYCYLKAIEKNLQSENYN